MMLNTLEIDYIYNSLFLNDCEYKLEKSCLPLISNLLNGNITKEQFCLLYYICRELSLTNLDNMQIENNILKITFNEIKTTISKYGKVDFTNILYFICFKAEDFKIYCVDISCKNNDPYKEYNIINLEKIKKDLKNAK